MKPSIISLREKVEGIALFLLALKFAPLNIKQVKGMHQGMTKAKRGVKDGFLAGLLSVCFGSFRSSTG